MGSEGANASGDVPLDGGAISLSGSTPSGASVVYDVDLRNGIAIYAI
jgi:hypothetical protein